MGIIAGILDRSGRKLKRASVNAMISSQRHRDPSGKAAGFSAGGLVMGGVNHFDSLASESSTVFVDGIVLVSDVELQRASLQASSKVPCSPSRAVAAAYEHWGLDFMSHLEGEFACAIWDANRRRLVLARDPYGHKPLHYYFDGKQFVFSSEIKGILARGIIPEIDLISLSDFLSLNCIPYPATIFKDIYQVPPGSLLVFQDNDIAVKPYWSPGITENKSISLEEAASRLEASIKEALRKRSVTKDLYCFLSGGIDSSAILSFAAEVSGNGVHAVSVGFEEEEENELEDAKVMAEHVGAELHQVIASPDSFFDMLDTLVFHHDSPFTDSSAYPTFFAADLGRQFTDIILTGDGPDQTMGGSGHHVFAVKHDSFSPRNGKIQAVSRMGAKLAGALVKDPSPTLVSKAQRKLYRDSLSPVHAAYDLRSYFPDIVKHFLCSEELWQIHIKNDPYRHPEEWFRQAGNVDDVNKYLYADMKFYVPDDLMIKVDRMCMAHGLETLSPFQDLGIASIVNQLPGSYKIHVTPNGEIVTKFILKKICKGRFPKHTLNKKKQGFGIPLDKWLKQDGGKKLREILLDPRTLGRGYFKKQAMERLVDVYISNRGDYFFPNPNGIVGLLTLELWHQRYLDQKPV